MYVFIDLGSVPWNPKFPQTRVRGSERRQCVMADEFVLELLNLNVRITIRVATFDTKAGDTVSSSHVSSRDVTSAVEIFNIEFWRTLTLLSLCLRHVI
jgi:hypothetical protein